MIFEIEEEDIKVLNDRLISIGYENVENKSMNEKIKLLINVINILEESERSLLEKVEMSNSRGEVQSFEIKNNFNRKIIFYLKIIFIERSFLSERSFFQKDV